VSILVKKARYVATSVMPPGGSALQRPLVHRIARSMARTREERWARNDAGPPGIGIHFALSGGYGQQSEDSYVTRRRHDDHPP
jgi:hypothetical protein